MLLTVYLVGLVIAIYVRRKTFHRVINAWDPMLALIMSMVMVVFWPVTFAWGIVYYILKAFAFVFYIVVTGSSAGFSELWKG